MLPRQATVSVLYNGANATGQIAQYLNSFQYKDVAAGTSDSISLVVNDPDRRWSGPWFPVKGDKIKPTIILENWAGQGQTTAFSCGTFGVDDFSFSGGPTRMNLEALALPPLSCFKTQERTETYERTTLKEIAQTIADRSGIALFFDAADVAIEKIEQNKQNDCAFICSTVEKCGLALKIFNDRLVIFSEADYEARGPKAILTPADFDPGWTWDTKQTGTYTGVHYQYTNSDKNKTFTVDAGTQERLLTCNEPADNLSEATTLALAALNNANKATTTLNITMMARPGLIASDCVEIQGLGRLSGKYYIDQITHSLGSGYKMSLELRKVEDRISSATSISSTVEESSKDISGGGGSSGGGGETPAPEPEPEGPVVGGLYKLESTKTGYYTAAEALAGTPLPGHPTGVRGPGTYYIFNISSGMLNLTTAKEVPGSWVSP